MDISKYIFMMKTQEISNCMNIFLLEAKKRPCLYWALEHVQIKWKRVKKIAPMQITMRIDTN